MEKPFWKRLTTYVAASIMALSINAHAQSREKLGINLPEEWIYIGSRLYQTPFILVKIFDFDEDLEKDMVEIYTPRFKGSPEYVWCDDKEDPDNIPQWKEMHIQYKEGHWRKLDEHVRRLNGI